MKIEKSALRNGEDTHRGIPMYLLICCLVPMMTVLAAPPPLAVVGEVDLARYAGTWYEIARLPNGFQKQCSGDVTATYTILPGGTIEVVNRCRQRDGQMREAQGRARLAHKNGSASKLKVRFAPAYLSFLPAVWGDYWILDLAPDYSYAVVGEPARRYLWILARSPSLDESVYQDILARLATSGYDLQKLVRTPQNLQ
jgi:apolipoprotein D and lipocalin family protein